MMSEKNLIIAFLPGIAYGHICGCISLGQTLLKRGHRVVFVLNRSWKGKLSPYGFDEEIYNDPKIRDRNVAQYFTEFDDVLKMSSFDKIKHFESKISTELQNYCKRNNHIIEEIFSRVKPHVIIVDSGVAIPAVLTSGVIWVNLATCNQLYYTYPGIDTLPPGKSGCATDGDKNEWKKFRDESIRCLSDNFNDYNSWIQSKGAEPLKDPTRIWSESPFLNLYLCPEELDYDDIRPKPSKWYNIDHLIIDKHNNTEFIIPESLREKRGKLIYFSFGTILSEFRTLMKNLILILSQSPNRFIVSKGQMGDDYELPSNMWGDNMLPQTKILPLVNLVINHGGNHTVAEALYFGKPIIVLPIWGDQYDNAQRIHEKKLGVRLDPFNCDPKVLLDAIETLIGDEELNNRLKMVSQRMKNSKSKERAAKLIKDLVI